MSNKLYALLTIFIICSTLIYFNERYWLKPDVKKVDTVTVSDTIYKDTTIVKDKLVPKYIKIIKRDTVINNVGDTIELVKENKIYNDTIICAGDSLEVTSYISGYEAKIDSLKAKLSKREIIKTEYITKYITQPKTLKDHFKVGIGVGYGYGLNNKQFEPFIGFFAGVAL